MNALESLLRPVAAMINRQIAGTTPARELCDELDGRTLAVRVRDTALAVYLLVRDGQLILSPNHVEDPDVAISGSLFALARLAGPAGENLVREGVVDIVGNVMTAQQFQKLLRYGRPDIEEEMSAVIGDVAAHGLAEAVRGVGRWGQQAGDIMQQNVAEYLQEESRILPGRCEVDSFRERVERLRDDTDRLAARVTKLESHQRADEGSR